MTLLGIGAHLEEGSRPGRGGCPALGYALTSCLPGRGLWAGALMPSNFSAFRVRFGNEVS